MADFVPPTQMTLTVHGPYGTARTIHLAIHADGHVTATALVAQYAVQRFVMDLVALFGDQRVPTVYEIERTADNLTHVAEIAPAAVKPAYRVGSGHDSKAEVA